MADGQTTETTPTTTETAPAATATPAATPPATGATAAAPEATQTPAATPAAEQPLLAGKFKTPADLEKAYVELQKVLGRKAAPQAPEAPKPTDKPAEPAKEGEAPKADKPADAPESHVQTVSIAQFFTEAAQGSDPLRKISEAAGIDPATVAQEFIDGKGTLTPETLAKYARVRDPEMFPNGIPPQVVLHQLRMQYTQAQAATTAQETIRTEAIRMVGDESKLNAMLAFASTEFDDARKASLQERLQSPKHFKSAIAEIQAAMAANPANGTGRLIIGTPAAAAPVGFSSSAEMRAAMNESRQRYGSWQNDPAFLARYSATPQQFRI